MGNERTITVTEDIEEAVREIWEAVSGIENDSFDVVPKHRSNLWKACRALLDTQVGELLDP